jgi:hypothetical protein
MTNAESEVIEPWAVVCNDESEDHSESTGGRGEVGLEALGKLGPVAVFWVAGPQLGARNPARFVSTARGFGGIAASRCRPCHVLPEGVGIEASRETRLAGQRLPLAVGGKHVRAMLRQEVLPLPLGGLAGT